jgi:hypothetical protein
VLPDTEDRPTSGLEVSVVATITRHVAIQLLLPVAGIRRRRGSMLGASMPVATIDKNGEPGSWEDDVGTTSDPRHSYTVLPEAKTSSVKLGPQGDLGAGIRAPVALHDRADDL